YYASQVIELGHPTVLALNMIDVAQENGHSIDVPKLSEALGVPVIPVVANKSQGIAELRAQIVATLAERQPRKPQRFCELPALVQTEVEALGAKLAEIFHERRAQAMAEALLILSNEKALASSLEHYPASIQAAVAVARKRLEGAGIDWRGAAIESRYVCISAIQRAVTTETAAPNETFSD